VEGLTILEASETQAHTQYNFKVTHGAAAHSVTARLNPDGSFEVDATQDGGNEKYTLRYSPHTGLVILYETPDGTRLTSATGDGQDFMYNAALEGHPGHSDPQVLLQPVREFGYPFTDSGIHAEVLESLRRLVATHSRGELDLCFRDIYVSTVELEKTFEGEQRELVSARRVPEALTVGEADAPKGLDAQAQDMTECTEQTFDCEVAKVDSNVEGFVTVGFEAPTITGSSKCGSAITASCEGTATLDGGTNVGACPSHATFQRGWTARLTVRGHVSASVSNGDTCEPDGVADHIEVGRLQIGFQGTTPLDSALAPLTADLCSSGMAAVTYHIDCCGTPGWIGPSAVCHNSTVFRSQINPSGEACGSCQ
jgi:hypothetical protein